jgi:lipopolysaccharide export system protein LptA
MRSLRWLLLVALVLVAAAVLGTYRSQRRDARAHRPAVPPSVPLDTKTAATDWEWGQSGNGQPLVKLFAKNFKQSADGNTAELEQIELRIFQKDGLHYNRIRSGGAQFDTRNNRLFSPGEAQITLDVPVSGEPPHQLTSITTSGINFDSKTGHAVSDQHVSFTFENGDGSCTGADYDPEAHILNLRTNVLLNLRGNGPGSKPMKVEAGNLLWGESDGRLYLSPWSKLTRDTSVIQAGSSTVQLVGNNQVQWIQAPQAHGTDAQPNRNVEYSADAIHVDYNDANEPERITGTGHAKLISHSAESETTISGDHVDMIMTTVSGENVLQSAQATGNGVMESRPVADPKGKTGDVKILKADLMTVHMRTGGKEIERVTTDAPGVLEFQPNQPARHKRILKADRMLIEYGPRNEIRSFHAMGGSGLTSTETYPSEEDLKRKTPKAATALTSSKTVDATFDDNGQLKQMKQLENFMYTEGVRKAQSKNATLQNDTNVMLLDSGARVSDDTGSTSADTIELAQNTGDFDAKGHVFTTRLPDPPKPDAPKKSESAMLDDAEPTQGSADRVTSANRNHVIHYVGNAVVWQTANRIQGDRVDIDRESKSVVADGKVVTQFQDQTKPIFTTVRSQHMVYTDADRLAIYSGGTDLERPSLSVKSATLRAYLNEKDSGKDSRVNRALGDGKVEIVSVMPDRQRNGTSEHGEYFTEDGKVILTGGEPQLKDTKRGNTKGQQLTWFTNDDRLLVNGAPDHQVQSHLHKK